MKSLPWNAASNCNDFSTADNSPPIIAPTATTTVANNTDDNRKSYILFAVHHIGIDTVIGEGHSILYQTFTRSMVVALFAFSRHHVSPSFPAVYFNFSNTSFNTHSHTPTRTDRYGDVYNTIIIINSSLKRTTTNSNCIQYCFVMARRKTKTCEKKLPRPGGTATTRTM